MLRSGHQIVQCWAFPGLVGFSGESGASPDYSWEGNQAMNHVQITREWKMLRGPECLSLSSKPAWKPGMHGC